MALYQPAGVWLREGNLVYMLEETGQYRKGVEILRNRFEVRVNVGSHSVSEATSMAEKVRSLLVEDEKQSGADLQAKAKAAEAALADWIVRTYPVDAEVEFKPYPNISPKKGRIISSGVASHGATVVQVYHRGGYYCVDPMVNPIKVLTPAEAASEGTTAKDC